MRNFLALWAVFSLFLSFQVLAQEGDVVEEMSVTAEDEVVASENNETDVAEPSVAEEEAASQEEVSQEEVMEESQEQTEESDLLLHGDIVPLGDIMPQDILVPRGAEIPEENLEIIGGITIEDSFVIEEDIEMIEDLSVEGVDAESKSTDPLFLKRLAEHLSQPRLSDELNPREIVLKKDARPPPNTYQTKRGSSSSVLESDRSFRDVPEEQRQRLHEIKRGNWDALEKTWEKHWEDASVREQKDLCTEIKRSCAVSRSQYRLGREAGKRRNEVCDSYQTRCR